jgi:hypothetical protein
MGEFQDQFRAIIDQAGACLLRTGGISMGEFEAIYGTVGLGLIVLGLPLLLELWQRITGWAGNAMIITSVVSTYVFIFNVSCMVCD